MVGCKAQSFFLYLSFLCLLRHRREDTTSQFLIPPLVSLCFPLESLLRGLQLLQTNRHCVIFQHPATKTTLHKTNTSSPYKQSLLLPSPGRHRNSVLQRTPCSLRLLSTDAPVRRAASRPHTANPRASLNLRLGGGVGRRRGGDNSQLQFCSAAAAA